MLTLMVKPARAADDAGPEVVKLVVTLDAEDFVGVFDQLEIWRSLLGAAGPFEEITAVDWRGARLPTDGGDPPASPVTGAPQALSGKSLTFLVNEDVAVTVDITGVDPIAPSSVATQIAAAGLQSWVDSTGQLVVQTSQPGTGAELELTGGDAAGALGLTIGATSFGKDPRIALQTTQERYVFLDRRGTPSAFYRTRLHNRLTGETGDFSQAFGGSLAVAVDDELLVTGSLDLVDVQGRPIANREVKVHTEFNGILVGGRLMAGTSITLTTDTAGHLDVVLVRGQKVTVAVLGTDLVRDVVVPSDPAVTKFSLFDPTLAGPDIFRVQVPDLVYAERRSL
jgi:hypothetical protein